MEDNGIKAPIKGVTESPHDQTSQLSFGDRIAIIATAPYNTDRITGFPIWTGNKVPECFYNMAKSFAGEVYVPTPETLKSR